jgi:hypothetical protein
VLPIKPPPTLDQNDNAGPIFLTRVTILGNYYNRGAFMLNFGIPYR